MYDPIQHNTYPAALSSSTELQQLVYLKTLEVRSL